jgi:hypothetical protein
VTLRFRNIDANPDDPVERWGTEGILTAIERGSLVHWRRIAAAVRADPFGPVAEDLVEALDSAHRTGVCELLRRALDHARDDDAGQVARRVRRAVGRSGLSGHAFAPLVGTSSPRLSTYRSGRVMPLADMLVRIERVGAEQGRARRLDYARLNASALADRLRSGPPKAPPS